MRWDRKWLLCGGTEVAGQQLVGRCPEATLRVVFGWCGSSELPAVQGFVHDRPAAAHLTTPLTSVSLQEQAEGGGASHQQVWIVQEFCNRGSLFEAVDRGMLQLPGRNGPDLRAVLATAQEIAGGGGLWLGAWSGRGCFGHCNVHR